MSPKRTLVKQLIRIVEYARNTRLEYARNTRQGPRPQASLLQ
jgi:hypothetical protein